MAYSLDFLTELLTKASVLTLRGVNWKSHSTKISLPVNHIPFSLGFQVYHPTGRLLLERCQLRETLCKQRFTTPGLGHSSYAITITFEKVSIPPGE